YPTLSLLLKDAVVHRRHVPRPVLDDGFAIYEHSHAVVAVGTKAPAAFGKLERRLRNQTEVVAAGTAAGDGLRELEVTRATHAERKVDFGNDRALSLQSVRKLAPG